MRDDLPNATAEVRATVAVECMRRADRIQAEESQVGWNGVPRSRAEALQAGLRECLEDFQLYDDAVASLASEVGPREPTEA